MTPEAKLLGKPERERRCLEVLAALSVREMNDIT